MKHLAQPLGTALLEGGVDPLGSGRALAQRLFYAPLVEALYGGACCLGIAAQRAGDPVGVLSSGAGKQDLAPTEDEGFRRAQALLQCLALGVRERTHEDWSFHNDQRSTLRTTCSEDALGPGRRLGRHALYPCCKVSVVPTRIVRAPGQPPLVAAASPSSWVANRRLTAEAPAEGE